MQEIGRKFSARYWPILRFAPSIRAHHKNLYFRILVDAVALALEPIIEPPNHLLVRLICSRAAEFDFAHLGYPRHVVIRPDHKLLAVACNLGTAIRAHSGEIFYRAGKKN